MDKKIVNLLVMMLAVIPNSFAAVKPVTENRRQIKMSAKTKKKTSGNSTAGFGTKKKEVVWQCIKNCGACCKLDKGPTFPSPEEIFDGPSDDIQVILFLFLRQLLDFKPLNKCLVYLFIYLTKIKTLVIRKGDGIYLICELLFYVCSYIKAW